MRRLVMKDKIPKLPRFQSTRVFYRDQEDQEQYFANAYQYGTSSHDGMSPAAIIYPENIDDIGTILHIQMITSLPTGQFIDKIK